MKDQGMEIGTISNYYGGLHVKEEFCLGGDYTYFWAIENHDGFTWEPIPKQLYDALMKYEAERFNNALSVEDRVNRGQDYTGNKCCLGAEIEGYGHSANCKSNK